MIKKLGHVAIVVRNLDETIELFHSLFGVKPGKVVKLPNYGVKSATITFEEGSNIELLEPYDPKGSIAKFLESKGEGLHHICLTVDDLDSELIRLAGQGVDLIDKKGRRGITSKVGYIHPKSAGGVMIALSQKFDTKTLTTTAIKKRL